MNNPSPVPHDYLQEFLGTKAALQTAKAAQNLSRPVRFEMPDRSNRVMTNAEFIKYALDNDLTVAATPEKGKIPESKVAQINRAFSGFNENIVRRDLGSLYRPTPEMKAYEQLLHRMFIARNGEKPSNQQIIEARKAATDSIIDANTPTKNYYHVQYGSGASMPVSKTMYDYACFIQQATVSELTERLNGILSDPAFSEWLDKHEEGIIALSEGDVIQMKDGELQYGWYRIPPGSRTPVFQPEDLNGKERAVQISVMREALHNAAIINRDRQLATALGQLHADRITLEEPVTVRLRKGGTETISAVAQDRPGHGTYLISDQGKPYIPYYVNSDDFDKVADKAIEDGTQQLLVRQYRERMEPQLAKMRGQLRSLMQDGRLMHFITPFPEVRLSVGKDGEIYLKDRELRVSDSDHNGRQYDIPLAEERPHIQLADLQEALLTLHVFQARMQLLDTMEAAGDNQVTLQPDRDLHVRLRGWEETGNTHQVTSLRAENGHLRVTDSEGNSFPSCDIIEEDEVFLLNKVNGLLKEEMDISQGKVRMAHESLREVMRDHGIGKTDLPDGESIELKGGLLTLHGHDGNGTPMDFGYNDLPYNKQSAIFDHVAENIQKMEEDLAGKELRLAAMMADMQSGKLIVEDSVATLHHVPDPRERQDIIVNAIRMDDEGELRVLSDENREYPIESLHLPDRITVVDNAVRMMDELKQKEAVQALNPGESQRMTYPHFLQHLMQVSKVRTLALYDGKVIENNEGGLVYSDPIRTVPFGDLPKEERDSLAWSGTERLVSHLENELERFVRSTDSRQVSLPNEDVAELDDSRPYNRLRLDLHDPDGNTQDYKEMDKAEKVKVLTAFADIAAQEARDLFMTHAADREDGRLHIAPDDWIQQLPDTHLAIVHTDRNGESKTLSFENVNGFTQLILVNFAVEQQEMLNRRQTTEKRADQNAFALEGSKESPSPLATDQKPTPTAQQTSQQPTPQATVEPSQSTPSPTAGDKKADQSAQATQAPTDVFSPSQAYMTIHDAPSLTRLMQEHQTDSVTLPWGDQVRLDDNGTLMLHGHNEDATPKIFPFSELSETQQEVFARHAAESLVKNAEQQSQAIPSPSANNSLSTGEERGENPSPTTAEPFVPSAHEKGLTAPDLLTEPYAQSSLPDQQKEEKIPSLSATTQSDQHAIANPLADIKAQLRDSGIILMPVKFGINDHHYMDIDGRVRTPFLDFSQEGTHHPETVIAPVSVEYQRATDTLLLHGKNVNGDHLTIPLESPTRGNERAYTVIREQVEQPLQKAIEDANMTEFFADSSLENGRVSDTFIRSVTGSVLHAQNGHFIHVSDYDRSDGRLRVTEKNDKGYTVNETWVDPMRIASMISRKEAVAVKPSDLAEATLSYPSLEEVTAKRTEQNNTPEAKLSAKYLNTIFSYKGDNYEEKAVIVGVRQDSPREWNPTGVELRAISESGASFTIVPDSPDNKFMQTGSKIDGIIQDIAKMGFTDRDQNGPHNRPDPISYFRDDGHTLGPSQTRFDGLMVDFGPNHFYFQQILSGPDAGKYCASYGIENLNLSTKIKVTEADIDLVYDKMRHEISNYSLREGQLHSIGQTEQMVKDIIKSQVLEMTDLTSPIHNIPTGDKEMADDPLYPTMDVTMVSINSKGIMLHGNGGPAPLDSLNETARFEVLRRIHNDMMDQDLDLSVKREQLISHFLDNYHLIDIIKPSEHPMLLPDKEGRVQTIGAITIDDHKKISLFHNDHDAAYFLYTKNAAEDTSLYRSPLEELTPASQRKVLDGALRFYHSATLSPEAEIPSHHNSLPSATPSPLRNLGENSPSPIATPSPLERVGERSLERVGERSSNQTMPVSPIIKQYFKLKSKHPDALLLFRVGDFYEAYGQDAQKASQTLGITLRRISNTKTNSLKGPDGKPLEIAGFPFHALDSYLPRLVRAGNRVAICEQLEKHLPKQQQPEQNHHRSTQDDREPASPDARNQQDSQYNIQNSGQAAAHSQHLSFSNNMFNQNSEEKIMRPDEQKPKEEQQKADPEIKNHEKAIMRETAAAAILAVMGSGMTKLKLADDERITLDTTKGGAITLQTISAGKDNKLSLYGEVDGTKKSIPASQLADDSMTKLADHVSNLYSAKQTVTDSQATAQKPVTEQRPSSPSEQNAFDQKPSANQHPTPAQDQKPEREIKPIELKPDSKVSYRIDPTPFEDEKKFGIRYAQLFVDDTRVGMHKLSKEDRDAFLNKDLTKEQRNEFAISLLPKYFERELAGQKLPENISYHVYPKKEQQAAQEQKPAQEAGQKTAEQKTEREAKIIELKPDSKVEYAVVPMPNKKDYSLQLFVDGDKTGHRLSKEDQNAFFSLKTPEEKKAFAISLLPKYFEKELNGQKLPESIERHRNERKQETTQEQNPENKAEQKSGTKTALDQQTDKGKTQGPRNEFAQTIDAWRVIRENDGANARMTFVQRTNPEHGKFYQTFGADAETVAKLTDKSILTVTSGRDAGLKFIGIFQSDMPELMKALKNQDIPYKVVDTQGRYARVIPERNNSQKELTSYSLPEGKTAEVTLFKQENTWMMNAKVGEVKLPQRRITEEDARAFKEQQATAENLVGKYYKAGDLAPKPAIKESNGMGR